MDDQHVGPFVEAVDGTNFHAIHILALDAVFRDDIRHGESSTIVGLATVFESNAQGLDRRALDRRGQARPSPPGRSEFDQGFESGLTNAIITASRPGSSSTSAAVTLEIL
jgi:hypothetical protein